MPVKYLASITEPNKIITAIDASIRFPEILDSCQIKYVEDIARFKALVAESQSTEELLGRIRSSAFTANQRMSLLKMFRRCVSPVLDTEMAKKITKVSTNSLIQSLGHTFKRVDLLQQQMASLTKDQEAALAALIGEYDTKGQLGYFLTEAFFTWFENSFHGIFTIEGPRGAGRDIELSSVFPNYSGSYPCDFVIRNAKSKTVCAIGFARYDSTRGGAQSDDRTGGNSDKVGKARELFNSTGEKFRLLFLADGPGLIHNDTWAEACKLDGSWSGNVRVTTMKTAPSRITADWLSHI
ncbi:hypothetical protein JHS3_03730 [Jeongeupia sp. HS-3]|uniref:hypothetical protein n=1 Tax=Jeongeupia sp. HS-3 TaxID=1009682 RepID=UPI0018A549D9|nr:hypothetical protein [Jeongeupia sp. HS-3]BCL74637.1 hypothetical protein JHS3_03730 [Jeongeupia sp. HS-3]